MTGTADVTATGARVVTGALHRVRRGKGKAFAAEAPAPPVPELESAPRPARVAIMLARAWKLQEAIDRGEVRDRAEVARRLGLTRARVTQLLDLTLLAPEIQEEILFLVEAAKGAQTSRAREIGTMSRSLEWDVQRAERRSAP